MACVRARERERGRECKCVWMCERESVRDEEVERERMRVFEREGMEQEKRGKWSFLMSMGCVAYQRET